MPLGSFAPLHVVLWILEAEDSFDEGAGEALCERAHVRGVIEVDTCSVGEMFETGDVFVDFPVLHSPLL